MPVSEVSKMRAIYRQANPCSSLQQVADKFGVTRERIRQDCRGLGIETRNARYIYSRSPLNTRRICPECGGRRSYGASVCHICRHKPHIVMVECAECGNLSPREQYDFLRDITKDPDRLFFCSKRCQGLFAGKNYGFIAHPENRGRLPKYGKEVLDEISKMRAEGKSGKAISNALGIPHGSIYDLIIRRANLEKPISSQLK